MVKNTTGGTGTKSLARKHQLQGDSNNGKLRLPECEFEIFGLVTKMLGNGMCEIKTNDDMRLIGHIRNKFRGKQKRHNMLSLNQLVLVGLREWEKPSKNCDILTMYEPQHLSMLYSFPNLHIHQLLLTLPDFQNPIFHQPSSLTHHTSSLTHHTLPNYNVTPDFDTDADADTDFI
jgi:initiation factor 1A